MDVEIFYYEVEDMSGAHARCPVPATLDFIEQSPHRRVISGSKRIVDERLVRGGRALFAPTGEEAKLLKDLERRGGITTEPLADIDIVQHELKPLIRLGLVDTEAKGDRLEMKISVRGYLALKQLAA
jgi:hypothetical protein